jgi:hypothetical protein
MVKRSYFDDSEQFQYSFVIGAYLSHRALLEVIQNAMEP